MINWRRPGWTWLANTAEFAVVAFAAALLAAWQDAPSHDLAAVDWPRALSRGGYEALGVILYAVVGLKVPNRTASWLRTVVAKPHDSTGR
ncbi:hypothetical protein [Mycobacterium avium]|uniref:hypothetical protein n=1 Tax=Mycobacterium avium TaxID=1764 RepID=UPI001F2B03C7|nr:hypothetical protein [Mycobacterium avium]